MHKQQLRSHINALKMIEDNFKHGIVNPKDLIRMTKIMRDILKEMDK